jgi:hypothetical protein
MTSLPGMDPDSQFFGNQDKLLRSRPFSKGKAYRWVTRGSFPCGRFLIACKCLKWRKNQIDRDPMPVLSEQFFNYPKME